MKETDCRPLHLSFLFLFVLSLSHSLLLLLRLQRLHSIPDTFTALQHVHALVAPSVYDPLFICTVSFDGFNSLLQFFSAMIITALQHVYTPVLYFGNTLISL